MKTIFKILAILTVAVLVGGLFYGVVNATSSGMEQSSQPERPAIGELSVDGEFSPPEREDETGGIQFPMDLVKNLVIISIVGIVYLSVAKWFGKKIPRVQSVS